MHIFLNESQRVRLFVVSFLLIENYINNISNLTNEEEETKNEN